MSTTVCGIRKLDYLGFTVKDCTSPDGIFEALKLKFMELGYGRFGYKAAAIAESGGITVYWDGFKPDMGIHVQVSGQGCRLLEAMPWFTSWREWIGGWIKGGARFSRIDVAIDDEASTVEFETVHQAVLTHSAVTRAKKSRLMLDYDGDQTRPTLYVGKRTSDTMMRCYDKGMQLGEGSWLRFEFEYKGERADAVARLLADKGWDEAVGVARSFIEFKDETHKTTDRTRQRAATWWVNLINASKHILRISRDLHASLLRSYTWLKRQAAPVMAVLAEYEGGDISWFVELLNDGKPRWKERHRNMLRSTGPSLLEAAT